MVLIVATNVNGGSVDRLTNRTGASGGSVGGIKKAGMWAGNIFMRVFNIGQSYTYRIPQRQPTLKQLTFLTTRSPLQYSRGSYAVTHSAMLG
jgi:hypothetical protein